MNSDLNIKDLKDTYKCFGSFKDPINTAVT